MEGGVFVGVGSLGLKGLIRVVGVIGRDFEDLGFIGVRTCLNTNESFEESFLGIRVIRY